MDTNNIEIISKINRGFQFTLPKSFRNANNLEIGDYLKIHEDNGKLVIEPVEVISKRSANALRTLFSTSEDHSEEVLEKQVMSEVRKEIKAFRKKRRETRN